MFKKVSLFISMISLILISTVSIAATAITPVPAPITYYPNLVKGGNLWRVTAYRDSATDHRRLATQWICFIRKANIGTHMVYDWYSLSFFDWNGRTRQEGDQIFMHGDYANDVGHDGFQWEIVTALSNYEKTEGAGHWHEWREDGGYGTTIGFANAKWVRVGVCPVPHDQADVYVKRIHDYTGKVEVGSPDEFELTVEEAAAVERDLFAQ